MEDVEGIVVPIRDPDVSESEIEGDRRRAKVGMTHRETDLLLLGLNHRKRERLNETTLQIKNLNHTVARVVHKEPIFNRVQNNTCRSVESALALASFAERLDEGKVLGVDLDAVVVEIRDVDRSISWIDTNSMRTVKHSFSLALFPPGADAFSIKGEGVETRVFGITDDDVVCEGVEGDSKGIFHETFSLASSSPGLDDLKVLVSIEDKDHALIGVEGGYKVSGGREGEEGGSIRGRRGRRRMKGMKD